MPGFRTPGPLGTHDEPDPFQAGISIPSCFGSEGAGEWFPGNPALWPGSGSSSASRSPTAAGPTAPVLLRRKSGPARVPLLGLGSTGGDVRKLQALLNLRLSPSPALRVDGSFGPLTGSALRQLQQAALIGVDGIAGKDTWRVLGTGKVYAGTQAAPPLALTPAAVAAASAPAAAPIAADAAARSPVVTIDDVLGWTAERKFLAVAQRAIDKMPGAARTELLAMISPNAVGLTLALWAASHLVGAGVVIDLALFGAGVYMVGTAVIGVMEELGHCLVQTHNAANQQELDEAAGMLAHVIVVVGVTVLVALLAKIRLKGRGVSQAGSAAEAEAASAARPKRSKPTRKPVVEEGPKRLSATENVTSLDPASTKFSQSSVNGVNDIEASMRANGWQGPPIDVIRMSDGTLTTFDNTRVLAAQRAGINVQAVIRDAAESFPSGRWTPKSGVQPATWEDAIRARIQQQNTGFRTMYPNGSPFTGSTQ